MGYLLFKCLKVSMGVSRRALGATEVSANIFRSSYLHITSPYRTLVSLPQINVLWLPMFMQKCVSSALNTSFPLRLFERRSFAS